MNELETLATIQDMLLELTSETMEATLMYLLDSNFNSFGKFNLFINIIFEISYKKRNLRSHLSLLCKNFSKSRKNPKKPHEFKHFFLSNFLKIEGLDFGRIHSHVHFYFLSMKQGFLTEDEIIDKMHISCDSDMANNTPCVVYFLLLYFSPIIKVKKSEFHLFLCNQLEYSVKKVTDFPKSLLRHWGRLPERLLWINSFVIENRFKIIEKVEWNERKTVLKNGFLPNSIELIILNDDVEDLQELVTRDHIDIDEFQCRDNFLVYSELFELNEISMLQLAAVFKSIKCFKYLFLNISKPYSFYNENNLMWYSVKGGNYEIIRILFQKQFLLDHCLSIAFLYFHSSVFKWIFQMDNQKEIELLESVIENESLLSVSLNCLLFLYKNDNNLEKLKKMIESKVSNERPR